jgi:hypothetical protein
MGLESQAALLVAASDLKVVRLLRAAMGTGICRATPLGPAPNPRFDGFEPRPKIDPTPRIEPRRVIHPTPRFEPRPVLHPRPRVEPLPITAPVEPEQPIRVRSPIEPPWKQLPWETPVAPRPQIKLIVRQPDTVSKGMLLDMFL